MAIKRINSPSYEFGLSVSNGHANLDDYVPQSKTAEPVPFFPPSKSMAFVSGFGNTLKLMNGKQTEYSGFDWYYKGNGNGIKKDSQAMTLPNYGLWGGFETEILTIHIVNDQCIPVYMGYTLGVDFTNTGLRRRQINMKNLSHLSQTVIASTLIPDKFPEEDAIHTNITRNGSVIWNLDGKAGTQNMWVAPKSFEETLFRNQELMLPGMVFYTLTGATMSSDKGGVNLKDGDKVNAYLDKAEVFLESVFKEQ